MKTRHLLAVASLLWAGALNAQSGSDCPTLPADSGLGWEKLESADFTFCKAIRDSDAGQAFAVMIAGDSPFRPRRGDRVAAATIDGREAVWYRSEVAGNPELLVRETLVEVDRDHLAHISLRATSEEELARTLRTVEGLRFQATRLSSK